MNVMNVGGRIISPGEKVTGYLKVGSTSTHDVRLPYIIIRGEAPGPTLCVLGGVHALEYASIEGVQRVGKELEPENMKGSLIIVPIVNMEGFSNRVAFNNSIDYVNQNRVFPGDPSGTMSRRVASTLFDNIISKADALIDSHGGDLTEDINKFVIIGKTEDKTINQKMVDMASCYDAYYISVTDIVGSTKEALTLYGIPCITPESGTPYPVRVDEVDFHYNGIMNVLRYMKIIDGEPQMKELVINPEQVRLFADAGGIWRPKINAGCMVEKGMILGEIVNVFGETIQTLEAPFTGLANNMRTSAAVNSGDTIGYVVKL
jgi:predicted deacylase